MTSPPNRRLSHSRSGCATCRRRRVRCDERSGVCANCARLGLSCSWYPNAELAKRSRVNKACDRCRKKKIRCTSSWASGPCEPCQSSNATCINPSQNRPSPGQPDADDSRSSCSPGGLPDEPEQRRLVDAYFQGPHYYLLYNFIHWPTFVQMLEQESVPRFLLLVVIATSLHFLEPQDRRADQWADECRRLVMLEIFSLPSTTTLQTLLLLQRYEWHRANHISAWFISGLASRLAHGLQLNIEILDRARVPVTVRETRRRLTWSCYVMESMIESGRKPLYGLDASSIDAKLPCNERSFQLGLETSMPDIQHLFSHQEELQQMLQLDPTSSSAAENRAGISAFLVKLADLRREILNWTLQHHPRNGGNMPSAAPWALDSPFYIFEQKLEEWQQCLPNELRNNPEVMHHRRSQLTSFTTLHCLFYGCYCDLYRMGSYITASQRQIGTDSDNIVSTPPPSFLAKCRRGRLENALAICNVISASMEHHIAGHDPVVGISAALATRVLLIERRQEDGEALGLTEEAIYGKLHAAVDCAKGIARRSVPIRDLFCSVCVLAKKRGYQIDISDISNKVPNHSRREPEPSREGSPSLRTYGTFGSIQSSLALRADVNAPAASSSDDKESDLFRNFTLSSGSIQPALSSLRSFPSQGDSLGIGLVDPLWGLDATAYAPLEGLSPGDFGMGSGWGDGTLNFSMMPLQFDWITQSLGFDFANDDVFNAATDM